MSCIDVNCNTPKGEKKSSKVTCTTTPKTADICGIVFFFYSVRGDLSNSSKKPDEEQKGCSRDLSAQKDVEWSTNKGGKCKLQLSQQPFLTITNITSLIIFNIYTDVHKIHSKRRFFFLSGSLVAFKSSCTFRAIRIKEYLYNN